MRSPFLYLWMVDYNEEMIQTMNQHVRFFHNFYIHDGECWEWLGGRRGGNNGESYGRFYLGNKSVTAHRFSYEMFIGPIPKGLTIDHLCRNKLCVNPDHLEAVTIEENWKRAGVTFRKMSHCKRGHPFTLENSYLSLENGRMRRWCRTCREVRGSR